MSSRFSILYVLTVGKSVKDIINVNRFYGRDWYLTWYFKFLGSWRGEIRRPNSGFCPNLTKPDKNISGIFVIDKYKIDCQYLLPISRKITK